MSITEAQENLITASVVASRQRMNFLPQMFPGCYLHGEHTVYGLMDSFCQDYNGAYWEFYTLSNGGFFMAPLTDQEMHIQIDMNMFEGVMSAQAAGVVVSLYALCIFAERTQNERIIDHYHLLRDFVGSHPESSKIYQAID